MEFRDLKAQYAALRSEIDAGIAEVIASARFISGPQVRELEEKLADYVGVKHCVTCANGTDALTLSLTAWGVGPGDAVFVPDFTFFASGECVSSVGAAPIFADVDGGTYNLDPDRLEAAIRLVTQKGKYRPRAVVAVDLFGLPADYDKIRAICRRYNLLLLEDGAQGFGGSIRGQKACSFGDISTTSFFPAKPLGCYGDGGAVFTDNDEWAALLRSLCVHGKAGDDKYNNARIGFNSRLDTLQAAILLPKLRAFAQYELDGVNRAAAWYTQALEASAASLGIVLPHIPAGFGSSWAQYTIQLPRSVNRDSLQADLKARGVPTMVYYPKPMHTQGAFVGTDSAAADCPVTERLCETVLSLPLHPYMEQETVEEVSAQLLAALEAAVR